jgi:hypothetical protein
MDEDIKKKNVRVCEHWIDRAVVTGTPEIVKKIFAVLDLIDGTENAKQKIVALEFLKEIKQTDEVKGVREYVENRKSIDGELLLF